MWLLTRRTEKTAGVFMFTFHRCPGTELFLCCHQKNRCLSPSRCFCSLTDHYTRKGSVSHVLCRRGLVPRFAPVVRGRIIRYCVIWENFMFKNRQFNSEQWIPKFSQVFHIINGATLDTSRIIERCLWIYSWLVLMKMRVKILNYYYTMFEEFGPLSLK